MKTDFYILLPNDYLNTPSNPGMQFGVAQRAGAAWVQRPREEDCKITCMHLLLPQYVRKAEFRDKVHSLFRTSKKPPPLPDCCVYSCDFTKYRDKLGWGIRL